MDSYDVYVQPSRPCGEEVIRLAVMDQLMPRRHMTIVLFFRDNSNSSQQASLKHLQAGLSAVLTQMPQFAGELRPAPNSRNELELTLGPESSVLFRVADRTKDADYDSLLDTIVSNPLLKDDHLVVPTSELTLPNNGTRPVVVQATLVRNGLLVATSIHHSLADAKATEIFFEAWARHTSEKSHGRDGSISQLPEDATARWRLSYGPKNVPLDALLELSGPKGSYQVSKLAERVVASTWTISPQALEELRKSVASSSGVQLSGSDLACALIARHVYKGRQMHEEPSTPWPKSIILYVTSDMRSRMEPPLAKDYLGNASVAIPVAVDLETLLQDSTATALSTIAGDIKTAIDKFDNNALRYRLAFYKGQAPYGSVVPNFEYYPGSNMLVTDSSSMGFYSYNWGANLHTTDLFRCAGQTHSVGQCALNPKRQDGTIEIQMRHDLRVVETIKNNEEFSKYCQLVGYY